MMRLVDLPDLVLRPFAERPDAAWYVAPPGKWNSAQIVEHLAMGIEWSATGFDERRARDPMVRRPRSIAQRAARVLVMHMGWFPRGVTAPSGAIPTPNVDRVVAEHRFRHALQRHQEVAQLLLPARARDLFVKHPAMGDLTLPEWIEFHIRHARHHVRQMWDRMPK